MLTNSLKVKPALVVYLKGAHSTLVGVDCTYQLIRAVKQLLIVLPERTLELLIVVIMKELDDEFIERYLVMIMRLSNSDNRECAHTFMVALTLLPMAPFTNCMV